MCVAARMGAIGKNLRGVAVKLGGGRDGLAGREWEEFIVPGIWEKNGGSVKGEEVAEGGRVNFDSSTMSLWRA